MKQVLSIAVGVFLGLLMFNLVWDGSRIFIETTSRWTAEARANRIQAKCSQSRKANDEDVECILWKAGQVSP